MSSYPYGRSSDDPSLPMNRPAPSRDLGPLLTEANELIRSFHAVCDRRGENTNWESLRVRVLDVLRKQHEVMHPEQYVAPREG